MTGSQFAFYLLPVSGPVGLLEVDVGDEVAVACNPIRMGRWSELMVVCVCHSDEVMREADANDTSGELGSTFTGSIVGESVLNPPVDCFSYRLFRGARVNGEH